MGDYDTLYSFALLLTKAQHEATCIPGYVVWEMDCIKHRRKWDSPVQNRVNNMLASMRDAKAGTLTTFTIEARLRDILGEIVHYEEFMLSLTHEQCIHMAICTHIQKWYDREILSRDMFMKWKHEGIGCLTRHEIAAERDEGALPGHTEATTTRTETGSGSSPTETAQE